MKYKIFSREILKCYFEEEGWGKWPTDSNKGVPIPAAQKTNLACEAIDLVSPKDFKFETKLQTAIKNRRTHRKFNKGVLTLKELSFLLWSTQGVTDKFPLIEQFHQLMLAILLRHI